MMKLNKSLTWIPIVSGFFIFTSFFLLGNLLNSQHKTRLYDSVFEKVLTKYNSLKLSLEQKHFFTQSLSAFVKSNPKFTLKQFNEFCEELLTYHKGIRSLGLLPNGVALYFYPLKGNEQGIGFDLFKDPVQREMAIKTRDSRKLFIIGPISLKQGGNGFLARLPIYLNATFWGFATAVFDSDEFFNELGLFGDSEYNINYAIRAFLQSENEERIIFGNQQIFKKKPISFVIHFSSGSWEIAGYPANGWEQNSYWGIFFIWMGLFFGLFTGFIVYRVQYKQHQKRKHYQMLAENSSDVIWTMNMSLKTTYVSPSIFYLTGFTAKEHMNQTLSQRFIPESAEKGKQKFKEIYSKILNGEISDKFQTFTELLEYKKKGGGSVCAEIRYKFVYDKNGHPIGIQGISRDITERKKAEEMELQNQENILATLETTSAGILICQEEKILYANYAFLKMTGYSLKELLQNIRMTALIHEEYRDFTLENIKARLRGQTIAEELEIELTHKNGNPIWVQLTTEIILYQNEKSSICTFVNIDRRKQMEEKFNYRLLIEKLVAWISSSFIHVSLEEFEKEILMSIKKIGYFLDLDRIAIIEKSDSQFRSAFSWHNPEIEDLPEELNTFSTPVTKWLLNYLNQEKPIFIPDISKLQDTAAEKEFFIRRKSKTVIMIPIYLEKKINSLICFESVRNTKKWDSQDSALLNTIGEVFLNAFLRNDTERQLALHTQRIEKELEEKRQNLLKAQEIQKKLNTQVLPVKSNMNLAAFYCPSEEVGGDFFSVYSFGEKIVILIGDCEGHGIEAAMDSVLAKAICDRYLYLLEEEKLSEFLLSVSHKTMEYFLQEKYLTLMVCSINLKTKELKYANANSELPYIIRKNQATRFEITKGYHIGFLKDDFFEEKTIQLKDHDWVFLYSDAIKEMQNPEGLVFGFKNIEHLLNTPVHSDVEKKLETMVQKAKEFHGDFPLKDDCTLIAFQILPDFIEKYFLTQDTLFETITLEINSEMEKRGYSDGERSKIIIGLEEMVINAFTHGNKGEPGKKVRIEVKLNAEEIELMVEDEGTGFIPEAVPDPSDFNRLKQLMEEDRESEYTHGRGIYLTRKCMDTFFYNQKGNRVNFSKKRSPKKTVFYSGFTPSFAKKLHQPINLLINSDLIFGTPAFPHNTEEMESLALNSQKEITVDFSHCYLIESREITKLLMLYQKLRKNNKFLIFIGLNPELKEIFIQLGFEKLGIQLQGAPIKQENH